MEKELCTITASRANGIERNSHVAGWVGKRYLLAVTLFIGTFTVFGFNANISIALIEMSKNRTIKINETIEYLEPEFNWTSEVKGLISSIYIYGRLFSLIGVLVVKKFGGVKSFGLSLFLNSIINFLLPFTVRYNFYLFLAARCIQGFLDIFSYISIFEIWSEWAPQKERSKLMAITFTGAYVGTAVCLPICGFLAHTWNWPLIFYFTGGVEMALSTMALLFSNEPSSDKYISENERRYLMQEINKPINEQVTYPWKEILTSKPIWALVITKFCFICGFLFITLYLSFYIEDMTNKEIHSLGMISSIPNVTSIIAVLLGGYLADYLQNKNILSATEVHKMYTFIGLVLAAVCIFVVIVKINFTINILFLIFFQVLISLSFLTQQLVPMYMAPRHAGLIAAILSYGIFAAGVVTRLYLGFVVTSHDPFQWSIYLSSLAMVLLIGGLTFMYFGTSEPQPWSSIQNEPDQELNIENLLP